MGWQDNAKKIRRLHAYIAVLLNQSFLNTKSIQARISLYKD